MMLRWLAALGALAVTAAGAVSSSALDFPLGTHVLAGRPTEVLIGASVPIFNASLTYGLEAPDASKTACAVVSAQRLSCTVTAAAAGDPVHGLYEEGDGGSSQLNIVAIHSYLQPAVAALTPAELPTAGGAKMTLEFTNGLGNGDVPRFDGMKALFFRACCSFDASCCEPLGEAPLAPGDGGYRTAAGRSPALAAAVGEQVEVHLALNGRTAVRTGQLATVVAKPKLKIGFIYVSAPDDFGWTFQHNLARLDLERRFFGQIETITEDHVAEWGPNECEFCASEPGWDPTLMMGKWADEAPELFGTHRSANVMRRWIEEEGVTMVFTTSFYYHWDTYHMALKYPDIKFVHVTGWLTRPNMAQFFPKVYQARYLSGIAMGWYIKKHGLPKKIGYVSAFPLGETVRAINAVKLGLELVDPDIDIYLIWALDWHNARKEDVATRRLIRYYGAEGIAQHTDSRSPQLAAKAEGKFGTGYNTDMLLTVGDSVLTSPILIWGNEYGNFVQKVLDGDDADFESSSWTGFESGSTRLSDLSPLVPAEAKMQIAEEQAKFERGEDTIFCKPGLTDNRGRVRNGPTNPAVNPVPWEVDHVKSGTTCLSDTVINQVCQEYEGFSCKEHWLLAGVHDHCGPSPRMPSGIQSPDLPAGTCFLGVLDLPDECAAGEFLQVSGCTKARVGHYTRDEKEQPCEPGYYADMEGLSTCRPCPSGSVSAGAGATECAACGPGRYANTAALSECAACGPGLFAEASAAAQCSFCAEGSYAASEGSSLCTPCPASMTTAAIASESSAACVCGRGSFGPGFGGSCSSCPAGSTTEEINSHDQTQCLCEKGTYMSLDFSACLECPETMTCPRGSSELNLARHLGRAGGDVYRQYPLLKPRYWASAASPMSVFECDSDAACVGGDRGDAACAGGLEGQACRHCPAGRIWSGAECQPCADVEASSLIFPLMPVFIAPLVFCGLYKLFGDRYESWGSWHNGIASSAFIVLNNYQIVALFRDLNVVMTKTHIDLFNFWSFSSDVSTIFRPQCAGLADFKSSMVVKALAPLCLIVMALLTWTVSQLLAKISKLRWLAMEKNRMLNVLLSLILTFFAGISAMAFSLFKCSPNPNGVQTLTVDRSINCHEGDWNGMVGLAVVAILVWCVGFGMLFAWAIYRSPRDFCDPDFQMRWKFLFIKYRPDVHWWCLLFVAKGILLNLGFLALTSGIGQVYWLIAILTLYLCAAIAFTPWRHMWVNILDIWAHTCLILTASTMVWFAAITPSASERVELDKDMARFTVACTFMLLPCIVPVLGYMIWSQQSVKAQRQRGEMTQELYELCRFVAQTKSLEEFSVWVSTLSDRDVAYLKMAKTVLAQELLHMVSRPGYSPSSLEKSRVSEVASRSPEATVSLDFLEQLEAASRSSPAESLDLSEVNVIVV